jgi:hypothetical protein
MLNTAGADGWELVSITNTNMAYLKRPIEELAVPSQYSRGATPTANGGNTDRSEEREERGHEVKAKYRDPTTNETWSGRGRMANWLKKSKRLARISKGISSSTRARGGVRALNSRILDGVRGCERGVEPFW